MRRFASALLSSVLLCGVLCPRLTTAQESKSQTQQTENYADKIRAFQEFARAAMQGDRIPGMTVGFAWGEYTWAEGFGFADLEHKVPAKPESAYRLASITKSMTGEAVVQLAERGKLDLDADIQKYVPDYPKQKWPVTVRNLLTHTGGSQKGTEALLYYFPERRLTIAVACNLQLVPTGKYVRRLYELLTGDAWEARVFTREKSDAPVALALNNAYNYGSLHFERQHAPLTNDAKELADAFAFFNSNVTREASRADFQKVSRQIRDARHPAGNLALVKLGSYVAARLKEKNGASGFERYRRGGAIPFFADYVKLYKSDSSVPKQLRFTNAFEKLIGRWDADWSRTWNDYTRSLVITHETDFDAVGARLRKEFAGAEVYPDYVAYLQPIQQGIAALKAPKLGVEFLAAAAALHTKDAAVQEMFGDFLMRADRKAEAEAQYRKAFALDSAIAKGSTLDDYLAGKLAPAPTPKP